VLVSSLSSLVSRLITRLSLNRLAVSMRFDTAMGSPPRTPPSLTTSAFTPYRASTDFLRTLQLRFDRSGLTPSGRVFPRCPASTLLMPTLVSLMYPRTFSRLIPSMSVTSIPSVNSAETRQPGRGCAAASERASLVRFTPPRSSLLTSSGR